MYLSKLSLICALTIVVSSGCENGKEIKSYRLSNANGISMRVMNYGCIIMELLTPDRDGEIADITLGYENLDGYLELTPYFGAIVTMGPMRCTAG